MRTSITIFLFFCMNSTFVTCQFGVTNKGRGTESEATIDGQGYVHHEHSHEHGDGHNPYDMDGASEIDHRKYDEMAKKLQSIAPIPFPDAVEIAALFEASKLDPETQKLVGKLKNAEEGQGAAVKLLSRDMTKFEIVDGLKNTLGEIKAADLLFADPKRAMEEMEKEGLIDKKRIDFYRENPEALAYDSKKAVYFTFLTLAVAGEFL